MSPKTTPMAPRTRAAVACECVEWGVAGAAVAALILWPRNIRRFAAPHNATCPARCAFGRNPVAARGLGRYPARIRQKPEKKDRKSTRLNSSHVEISYAVFCLKKKKNT